MKLVISVNVGLPREIDWQGKRILTSIWKEPVAGRVRVGPFNLEGDQQSDLSVHGGARKSVYAYPSEHYADWRRELPGVELPWGVFGENLTIEGLLETDVRIGDRLSIGSAEFVVTQPRRPCFKLGNGLASPGWSSVFSAANVRVSTFPFSRKGTWRRGTPSRSCRPTTTSPR